jgi:hypothetical protein
MTRVLLAGSSGWRLIDPCESEAKADDVGVSGAAELHPAEGLLKTFRYKAEEYGNSLDRGL